MPYNEPPKADPAADEQAWQRVLDYGERRAKAAGIRPEDVQRLIEEYRAEMECRG